MNDKVERCSCLWSHNEGGDGFVYMADTDCPLRPHPRTMSKGKFVSVLGNFGRWDIDPEAAELLRGGALDE